MTTANFSIRIDQEVSVTLDICADFGIVLDGKEIDRWEVLSAELVASTMIVGTGKGQVVQRHVYTEPADCTAWLCDWIEYAQSAGRKVFRSHHDVIDSDGNTVPAWLRLPRGSGQTQAAPSITGDD